MRYKLISSLIGFDITLFILSKILIINAKSNVLLSYLNQNEDWPLETVTRYPNKFMSCNHELIKCISLPLEKNLSALEGKKKIINLEQVTIITMIYLM